MRPIPYIKTLIILLVGILTTHLCQAQDAAVTPSVPAQASSGDPFLYMMVGLGAVLLIVISVLGQVLIRLTLYVYESKDKLPKAVLILLILSMSSHSLLAQDLAVNVPAQVSKSTFSLDFIAAMTVLLTEALVIFIMLIRISALINTISPRAKTAKQLDFELPRWFDSLNKSVAVEYEKDVMLDHDYDGIRELDNQLPPWWKWGFVMSIIFAICYFSYYHIFLAAPLSAGEYETEMAEAKVAKEAYMKTVKNNVDENTIVYDASYIEEGQKIYIANCVACHGAKGEGGVGPNLTDNYWLHGGKINDIFKTVKYGWPANGMKSWQTDLSAVRIAQVVCFVKSLKGTNPLNPKDSQGDLYKEDGGNNKDSTATATALVDTVGR